MQITMPNNTRHVNIIPKTTLHVVSFSILITKLLNITTKIQQPMHELSTFVHEIAVTIPKTSALQFLVRQYISQQFPSHVLTSMIATWRP